MVKPISDHETYPEKSIKDNIIATTNLCLASIKYKIKIIYISTDEIENDGNYFNSKRACENIIKMTANFLIFRGAFCEFPYLKNNAYTNVFKNFIYQTDFAKIIHFFLDENGIINIGEDLASHFDFCKKSNKNVKPITLNREKIKELDLSKMKELLQ
jgi:dTDP-4-dehydrorhamnose reductase